MSLKDMISKIFKVKKYKIIKFDSIEDKEELYFVRYRESIFSGFNYLLKNDIIDIVEATLVSDDFNVSSYIRQEKLKMDTPFLRYCTVIEKYDRRQIQEYVLPEYRFTDIEQCEEKIENHKKIIEFIKRKEKEDRIKEKKAKPKTVKRY